MRRVTLVVVVVLLAVVPPAAAKVGVELDKDPAALDPGEETGFVVVAMNEPRDPEAGDPTAVAGVRPLVTFRNTTTGDVVRVRASRTDQNGFGTGRVTLPSRGKWAVEVKAPGLVMPEDYTQELVIGSRRLGRVVETVDPPPDGGGSNGGGFPWLPVALGAGALAAGAWRLGPRRLRTILPARFGGAA